MDSAKYGKVVQGLQRRGLITLQQLVRPKPASVDVLAEVHDRAYLEQLHTSSAKVAQVSAVVCGDRNGRREADCLYRALLVAWPLHVTAYATAHVTAHATAHVTAHATAQQIRCTPCKLCR